MKDKNKNCKYRSGDGCDKYEDYCGADTLCYDYKKTSKETPTPSPLQSRIDELEKRLKVPDLLANKRKEVLELKVLRLIQQYKD